MIQSASTVPGPRPSSGGKSKAPKIVSLFSGAGGLDLGFSEAGFEIAFATDSMACAERTHRIAFPNTLFWRADLLNVTTEEFLEAVGSVLEPNEPIAVIGGPPCQGFSRSNSNANLHDPRNELTLKYAHLVKAISLKYRIEFVLFENVLGFLGRQNEPIVNFLSSTLSDIGLQHNRYVFDAIAFGVPQRRKRVIVFGSRGKAHLTEPVGTEDATVRTTISHLSEPDWFSRDVALRNEENHPNHWAMNPKSHRFSTGDFDVKGRSFRKLDWDSPSPTIAMGNREMPVHPNGNRRISIYEAMLLQGFPPNYRISGTFSEQVTQVSNAVPPAMAREIAAQIRRLYE